MKVSDLIPDGEGLRRVRHSKSFEKELKDYRKTPEVAKQLAELIAFRRDPRNDLRAWSKKDEMMRGPLARYRHAHLVYGRTVVIYRIEGDVLYLIALTDHKPIDVAGSRRASGFADTVQSTMDRIREDVERRFLRMLSENRIFDHIENVRALVRSRDPRLVRASFYSYTFRDDYGNDVVLRPIEARRSTLPLALSRRIIVPSKMTAEDVMDGIRMALGNGPLRVSPAFVSTVVNASLGDDYLEAVRRGM